MKRTLAALAVSLSAGCSPRVSDTGVQHAAGPHVDSISPSAIKANFNGSVNFAGWGFSGASFTANGHPISNVPGATLVIADDSHARIDFAYGGTGHEIPPGFYQITVDNGAGVTNAPDTLAVRTFLATVEHVRTLALPFSRTAGKTDFFVRPRDFQGALLSPGHPLAGATGLGASSFAWHTTRVTAVGSSTPLPLGSDAIGGLDFQFIGEGSGTPLAIAMAIDQSGSMHDPANPSDANDARVTQAEAFVNTLGEHDKAAVYRFQNAAVTRVVDFTSNKGDLIAGLETLRSGVGGATPLYDAMSTVVAAAAAASGTNGEFVTAAVVLTDGIDTSSTATPAQVIASAQALHVPVFSIGLGNPNVPNSLDPVQMQAIADQTGGRVFLAQDPNALESVFNSLEGTLTSDYEVEADIVFTTPLPAAGSYVVEGDLRTTVDGEQITLPVPAFTISAFN